MGELPVGDWEVVGEEGRWYQLMPCCLLVSQSLTVLLREMAVGWDGVHLGG